MQNVKLLNEKNNTGRIFIVCSVLLFLAWFVLLVLGNDIQKDIFIWRGQYTFNDYYDVSTYSCKLDPYMYGQTDTNVYNHNYLPIVYCIFYLLSKCAPYTTMAGSEAMRTSMGLYTSQVVMFIWFGALILVLEYLMRNYKHKKLAVIAMFLTGTILFTYERGNIITLTAALAGFFVAFYKSENKILKELSLIALALAACFKLYPAALGMLLLRNKDWKGAIRSALYALAFAIIPFAFVKGGFKCIKLLARNVAISNYFYSQGTTQRFGYGYFYRYISAESIDPIGGIVDIILAASLICTSVFRKKEWLAVLGLVMLCIFYPDNSGYYTSIYLLIPLAMMIGEKEIARNEYVYLALIIITVMPLKIISLDFSTLLEVLATYLIAVLCTIDGFKDLIHYSKNKRNKELPCT